MRSLASTTTTTSLASSSSSYLGSSSSSSSTSASGGIMNSSNLASPRLDWESLRKQARQLENEIDSKLVAFSKLCSSFAASTYSSSGINSSATKGPMSSSASSDLLFVTLSNEIEEALKKLTFVNSKMSDTIGNEMMSDVNSSGTVHTLQRHRDILRDYSHEYEKTKRNILSYKEREKLLSSNNGNNLSRSSSNNENNLNNRNNSTSLYMKEYDHLKSSHLLIDQQLEIAELTKENLQSQKQSLRLIQQKMNTLAHKFPMINNLVQRIKMKKRKDSIVLALVISFCLILMILYLF